MQWCWASRHVLVSLLSQVTHGLGIKQFKTSKYNELFNYFILLCFRRSEILQKMSRWQWTTTDIALSQTKDDRTWVWTCNSVLWAISLHTLISTMQYEYTTAFWVNVCDLARAFLLSVVLNCTSTLAVFVENKRPLSYWYRCWPIYIYIYIYIYI